jgi:hypothetical protein
MLHTVLSRFAQVEHVIKNVAPSRSMIARA